MKIIFTHKKKKVEIPVFGVSTVKLYGVPTAYSPDGYFAAVWGTGELEPVPGCQTEQTELLAHISLGNVEGGGLGTTETFCAVGVTYALS